MLIKCKECGLQISDKAIFCPHCGLPIKPEKISKAYRRKRLPNGFGQITKLKNINLRNPYRAMITVGKTEEGKPIQKLLKPNAYFSSYEDAYNALVNNSKDPYTANADITLEDVYNSWSEEYYPNLSKSAADNYRNSWRYMTSIKDIKMKDLRAMQLKNCLKQDGISMPNQKVAKFLLNKLYDYAIENDIVDKNIARIIKLNQSSNPDMKHHIAFTEEEMNILWSHKDNVYVKWILIQCYSGLRPSELCDIKIENINLEENYMVGGMKTKAGKDRVIPIHPVIKQFIVDQISLSKANGCDNLLCSLSGEYMKYSSYKHVFGNIMKEYNLSNQHNPHDARKFFITAAKKCNLDEYAIKLIVGHAIQDITEKIYTERDASWLVEQISMINV